MIMFSALARFASSALLVSSSRSARCFYALVDRFLLTLTTSRLPITEDVWRSRRHGGVAVGWISTKYNIAAAVFFDIPPI